MFIKIIDDKEIIKNDKFYTLNLSKKNSNNFITINPFRIEHYNDIDLFNLKVYCDEKNIILRVLSSMNYLPVNSQYADVLVLNENEDHMNKAYDLCGQCITTLNSFQFNKNWKGFLEIDFHQKKHILDRYSMDKTGVINSIYNDINFRKLNKFLKTKTTFIRKSTYDIFKKDMNTLPKNILLCEIKGTFKKIKEQFKNFDNSIGTDYEFQKSILKKYKHHYMGIQMLGSLFLNWQIIAMGGSARLFSMLPTRNIILMATDILGNDKKIIPKKIGWIQNKRLPWIGNQIHQNFKLKKEELDKIKELILEKNNFYGVGKLNKINFL